MLCNFCHEEAAGSRVDNACDYCADIWARVRSLADDLGYKVKEVDGWVVLVISGTPSVPMELCQALDFLEK